MSWAMSQATGWGQCFMFPSVLVHSVCWLGNWNDIWRVLSVPECSVPEQVEKETEGDLANSVLPGT